VRERVDNVLFKYQVPSGCLPINTRYSLIKQKWLIEDQVQRKRMINGIGPFYMVRSNMGFSAFYNEVNSVVMEKDRQGFWKKKSETKSNGLLAYATNRHQILIQDWQDYPIQQSSDNCLPQQKNNLEELNPFCFDFAPFQSLPFTEPVKIPEEKAGEAQEQEGRLQPITYPPQLEMMMGCTAG
jgi:hypothetical protein